MLTGITLENFKAFKEPQFIPIKPITLVFGPNSAGKSSIVHALAFLKHVDATKGHCDPGVVEFGWEKIKLGSWQNLVHGHDPTAVMKIKLHCEHDAISWTFKKGPEGPYVESFEITVNDKTIVRGTNQRTKGILWSIELHHSHPFWNALRYEIWRYVTGNIKLDEEYYDETEDAYEYFLNDDQNHDTINFQSKILKAKSFHAEFDKWLGLSWRKLGSESGQGIELIELFPGVSQNETFGSVVSEKKNFQILPIHLKQRFRTKDIEF